ncbi:MAG: hypothetical protein JWM04_2059, partial [Verrucomicrobiales bacterium]|nr:hypothetical protein [Verrucomicrobiales bacterium]
MKKTFSCSLLLLCLVAVLPVRAFVPSMTDTGTPIRWNLAASTLHTNLVNPTTKAIRFFLANDGYSTTNTAAELNSVRAAFAQWQTIPGSTLKFEEGGLVVPKSDMINPSDKTNVVYWEKTSHIVYNGALNIQGALGFCQYTYSVGGANDGYFLGADIVLNGLDYQWHTDYLNGVNNPAHLVEDVACHEIGHFIGLDHSPTGGATMLFHSGAGIGLQVGPSEDEFSAVRFLYPIAATNATLGTLKGKVVIGTTVVPGAAVFLENSSGNVVSSTVALTNGLFTLRSIVPGNYLMRAYPLDPEGAEGMISPFSISTEYTNVNVNFLPSANIPVTITANQTISNNIPVANGPLPYRIGFIRYPSANGNSFRLASLPAPIKVGQSGIFLGVAGVNLPVAGSGATLSITGDGLTIGSPIFQSISANPVYHVISVQISVSASATPGLRSFVLTDGANTLYANGFLE